eukprot:scaffold37526_cov59-Cyclotella_meneghiniana.AAC.2
MSRRHEFQLVGNGASCVKPTSMKPTTDAIQVIAHDINLMSRLDRAHKSKIITPTPCQIITAITEEDRVGKEALVREVRRGGGSNRLFVRGVINVCIVIQGGAGRGVVAAAGVGIVGEILTGIAVTGVTDENVHVTVVEIGAVLLVMEALLPISGDDSILTAVASTTSPNSLID